MPVSLHIALLFFGLAGTAKKLNACYVHGLAVDEEDEEGEESEGEDGDKGDDDVTQQDAAATGTALSLRL